MAWDAGWLRSARDLVAFIEARADMVGVLRTVAALDLPDAWVGAGFVRNAVWDALHGRAVSLACADVDVVYFDLADRRPERDAAIEAMLAAALPSVPWSVKNQARMSQRNGDAPYTSTADGLRHWPERCTAVAARWRENETELLAPFGVEDLVGLRVRPTPAFAGKLDLYRERLRAKDWARRWPMLRIEGGDARGALRRCCGDESQSA